MRYARIVNNAVAELREFAIAPNPNPAKGLDWRPCPAGAIPAIDNTTEAIDGPKYQIAENAVTETYSKRNLTAEELEARKEMEAARYGRLNFEVNFDQENRLRALEGKAPVTRVQYRAALKASL